MQVLIINLAIEINFLHDFVQLARLPTMAFQLLQGRLEGSMVRCTFSRSFVEKGSKTIHKSKSSPKTWIFGFCTLVNFSFLSTTVVCHITSYDQFPDQQPAHASHMMDGFVVENEIVIIEYDQVIE